MELDNFRKPQNTDVCRDIGKVFPPFKKIASMWKIILSSLGIGTLIGAIPGTGASIAVFMSRNAASGICSRSKGKLDMPGTGCLEGVFAPEVANNAVTGGALIPALSLGIPGDAATAVLIGALMTWFCTVLHEYAIGVLYLYYIANLQYFYGSISAGWRSVLSKNPVDFPEGVDAGDFSVVFPGTLCPGWFVCF